MTYSELRNLFYQKLQNIYGKTECDEFFYRSIEKYNNYSKTDYILNSDKNIDEELILLYNKILSRLVYNEPIQYVLGEAWFLDRKYFVNKHVLIPRLETEELIMRVVKNVSGNSEIIDLGTGSGCIAITLALELTANITAVDKSFDALSVAKKNADLNKANVNFLQMDMLSDRIFDLPKFDIIVSNPPYVTNSEKNKMMKNVLDYEPELALFVDDSNPLEFYIAIRDFANKNLKKHGRVIVEINEMFGHDVSELFNSDKTEVFIHKDIHGKDRFVEAVYF